MEIKPLYQGMEVYTDEADELSNKVRAFLDPIFRQLSEDHFSIRDAAHIITDVVRELEAYTVLKRNMDEHKKLYPRPKFNEKVK